MNRKNRVRKKRYNRLMQSLDVEFLVRTPDGKSYYSATNNAIRLKTNQPFFRKGGVQ